MSNVMEITVDAPPGKRVPRWIRKAGFSEDGTIYLPAALCDNENRAFLSASWDGVGFLGWDKHVYLPAEWLAQEYPDTREKIAAIADRIRQLAFKLVSTQPEGPTP